MILIGLIELNSFLNSQLLVILTVGDRFLLTSGFIFVIEGSSSYILGYFMLERFLRLIRDMMFLGGLSFWVRVKD